MERPWLIGNEHNRKHGFAKKGGKTPPEYKAWDSMKSRCLNDRDASFKHYGARGIRVCEQWVKSFEAFLADVGLRPSARHSLGRKDNNGNYEPGNVRWETPEEQQGNTRANRVVEAFGKKQILTAWSQETGIPLSTLWVRLTRLKWNAEKALRTPVRLLRPRSRLP